MLKCFAKLKACVGNVMATFRGSEWDQMVQIEAQSATERQGGVPRPNFPIGIHIFVEHELIPRS